MPELLPEDHPIFPSGFFHQPNYLFVYFFDPLNFTLIIAAMLRGESFESVIIKEVGRGVSDMCNIKHAFGLFQSKETDSAGGACL
jgi:hypothetical protein